MSVLVRGMKMPMCCEECRAESVEENYYGDVMSTECPFIYKGYTEEVRKTGRLEECPLVGVTTPHGRLIDADRLVRELKNIMSEDNPRFVELMYIIGQSTIIGAESGT